MPKGFNPNKRHDNESDINNVLQKDNLSPATSVSVELIPSHASSNRTMPSLIHAPDTIDQRVNLELEKQQHLMMLRGK